MICHVSTTIYSAHSSTCTPLPVIPVSYCTTHKHKLGGSNKTISPRYFVVNVLLMADDGFYQHSETSSTTSIHARVLRRQHSLVLFTILPKNELM